MNKLIICLLVFSGVLFVNSIEKDNTTKSRLEILTNLVCVDEFNNVYKCSDISLNHNLNECKNNKEYQIIFEQNTFVEFFVIDLDDNKNKLISYKIEDQDTKFLNFENNLIWIDVNSELKNIKFFNFDYCMLENLTFYGRK